jgi:hypothetical protein
LSCKPGNRSTIDVVYLLRVSQKNPRKTLKIVSSKEEKNNWFSDQKKTIKKIVFLTANLFVGVVVLGQHPDVPQAVHQVGQGLLHLLEIVGHHLDEII